MAYSEQLLNMHVLVTCSLGGGLIAFLLPSNLTGEQTQHALYRIQCKNLYSNSTPFVSYKPFKTLNVKNISALKNFKPSLAP